MGRWRNFVGQVFMNHLDLGFDGINPTIGYVSNVIKKVRFERESDGSDGNAIRTAHGRDGV